MSSKGSQSLSLAQAMEFSDDGRFICTSEYPYGIMYANKSWTRMTDYQQHEIEGKDLCFMQGALSDSISLKHMMYNVQLTGCGKASLINYTKSGKPFWCDMIIQPILSKDMYGDEQITHLLGTLVKTSKIVVKGASSSYSASSDGSSEQEGNEWTASSASASSDNENDDSVSSWNSTSDNGSSSPYMDRDSGDDSSEEISEKKKPDEAQQSAVKVSAKRPRLEITSLSALSSSVPEKKIKSEPL